MFHLMTFYFIDTFSWILLGLLERPSVPPSVPQVSFKLYVCGSSGSGKSYFVQRLAGTEVFLNAIFFYFFIFISVYKL